ncbi:GAF and ANTAR domain-containing protein [Geodermatophilus sp. SYSU D00710]
MTRPDDRFAAALLDLGLVPLDRPLPLLLDRAAGLAAEVLGGQPAFSVTVVGPEGGTTVGTSSQVAASLDEEQYRVGEGPCLEAATTGEPRVVADTEGDRRWPGLTAAAAAAGLRSVVSMPFPAPRPVPAGLNLYLQSSLAADDGLRERAERFARHAAVPVANTHLHARTVQQVHHLQTALASRAVIDQAKGILMERFRFTATQAFDVLARVSNETNTKLRDVAARLVDTGEFPPR